MDIKSFKNKLNSSILEILEEYDFKEVQKIMEENDYKLFHSKEGMKIFSVDEVKSMVLSLLLDERKRALKSFNNKKNFPIIAETGRFRVKINFDGSMVLSYMPVQYSTEKW